MFEGLIWIALILSILLTLGRIFNSDYDDGNCLYVGDACIYADPAFAAGTEYSGSSQHFYQYTASVTGLATLSGQAFSSTGSSSSYNIFIC